MLYIIEECSKDEKEWIQFAQIPILEHGWYIPSREYTETKLAKILEGYKYWRIQKVETEVEVKNLEEVNETVKRPIMLIVEETQEYAPSSTKGNQKTTNWETHLIRALLLVRNLRAQAVMQHLDPKAVRVALKYALIVDTYLAKQHGLTPEEDKKLSEIAQDLFKQTPKT
jgi:hypothetical protein